MDPEARFRAIFNVAYPALGRYALYRGVSKADAEDLVGATLEVAWRRIDDIPADDPLPWLYAVARNLLMNMQRRNRRDAALIARLPAPEADPAHEGKSHDVDHEKVRAALNSLSEDDQELLKLVAWDGLAPSQVAVVLGVSAVATRTRLHRARRRLAARLELDDAAGIARCPDTNIRNPKTVEVTDV
jgi:RNA polymerase sigma factor (sigma-70 family)